MIKTLLDTFIPHAIVFGFFLHVERFKQAALQSQPYNLSPALLNTVFLWGAQLSTSSVISAHEHIFLQRALASISSEVRTQGSPSQLLHTVQAQVLLATYFFRNSQFLEAEFHINGAISISFNLDLHRDQPHANVLSVFGDSDDSIADGERVQAFWTIFVLHRQLMLSIRTPTNAFGPLENPFLEIDTPWPIDMAGYDTVSVTFPLVLSLT